MTLVVTIPDLLLIHTLAKWGYSYRVALLGCTITIHWDAIFGIPCNVCQLCVLICLNQSDVYAILMSLWSIPWIVIQLLSCNMTQHYQSVYVSLSIVSALIYRIYWILWTRMNRHTSMGHIKIVLILIWFVVLEIKHNVISISLD